MAHRWWRRERTACLVLWRLAARGLETVGRGNYVRATYSCRSCEKVFSASKVSPQESQAYGGIMKARKKKSKFRRAEGDMGRALVEYEK